MLSSSSRRSTVYAETSHDSTPLAPRVPTSYCQASCASRSRKPPPLPKLCISRRSGGSRGGAGVGGELAAPRRERVEEAGARRDGRVGAAVRLVAVREEPVVGAARRVV